MQADTATPPPSHPCCSARGRAAEDPALGPLQAARRRSLAAGPGGQRSGRSALLCLPSPVGRCPVSQAAGAPWRHRQALRRRPRSRDRRRPEGHDRPPVAPSRHFTDRVTRTDTRVGAGWFCCPPGAYWNGRPIQDGVFLATVAPCP